MDGVFYSSLICECDKIEDIIENVSAYYPPQTPIIIADKISWRDEKIIKSTIGGILAILKNTQVSRQSLILIGKVYETANINRWLWGI